MILKKIDRGLYECFDDSYNHYMIEDSTREKTMYKRPADLKGADWKWGIYEQEGAEWIYLDGNPTMADCLEVINTWQAANEYLR
jgi:hypothetical protein